MSRVFGSLATDPGSTDDLHSDPQMKATERELNSAPSWEHIPEAHTIQKAEGTREANKLKRLAKSSDWPFRFVPNGNGCYGMYARLDAMAIRPKTQEELAKPARIKEQIRCDLQYIRNLPQSVRLALEHTDWGRLRCSLWSDYRTAQERNLAAKVLSLEYVKGAFDAFGVSPYGPRIDSALQKLQVPTEEREKHIAVYQRLTGCSLHYQ